MSKKYSIDPEIESQLFGFSKRTLHTWRTDHYEKIEEEKKRKKHPILDLIEKYFSEEDIKNFIKYNKVEKYEYLNYLYEMEKSKLLKMTETLLDKHSDVAKFILKLIQKYEQRYYDIKRKHKDAQNEIQSFIYYGENEGEFDEILKHPDGYCSLNEYLASIIFMPDKLSEILGKKLLPQYLFDLQCAIRQITEEELVPVIKRNMNYLLKKSESYKSENELRSEYEKYESEQQVEYQYDIETLTELLKKKKVIVPKYESNPYGDIEILENEDEEYVMTLHNDISKFEDMYPEKSYLELVDLAIKARPSSSMMQQKIGERSVFNLDAVIQAKNKDDA